MSDPTPTKCDYGRCSNGMHYNRYREVIEPCPDSTSDPTPTLIERLREGNPSIYVTALFQEAASALEAKDAEIERLTQLLETIHNNVGACLAGSRTYNQMSHMLIVVNGLSDLSETD